MASVSVAKASGAGPGPCCSPASPNMAAPPILISFEPGRCAGAPNLADVVHFLCALHGRHPGIVDLAAARIVDPAGRAWLASAAEAAAAERLYLTRLAVAAGPVPSTPGGGGSEAAIAQRSALAPSPCPTARAALWVPRLPSPPTGPRSAPASTPPPGASASTFRPASLARRASSSWSATPPAKTPPPSGRCYSAPSSCHCSTADCGICSRQDARRAWNIEPSIGLIRQPRIPEAHIIVGQFRASARLGLLPRHGRRSFV